MSHESTPRRAYAYIDGFNFYHASLEVEAFYPYGWCNWKATIQNYCGLDSRVIHVKYFTSLVRDAGKSRRQTLHINAMKTVADVIEGEFARRPNRKCELCRRPLVCASCGSTEHTVEKKTDVNIAVHMLTDAMKGLYMDAYLVTRDRDLLPVVAALLNRRQFPSPLRVNVLFPPGGHTDEFRELEQRLPGFRCIDLSTSKMVRFPEELAKKLGDFRFPEHWKIRKQGSAPANANIPQRSVTRS